MPIPRPPPDVFRDDGYKDSTNNGHYRDDVDDDDDDDDDEIVIDTTDHIGRIRTASQRSFSTPGMNPQNSSSNMSVGGGSVAADPPGSVYSDSGRYRDNDDNYNIGNSSSFEFDDTDEADPVFVSSRQKKKGRKSKGDLAGASDGIIVSPEKARSGSCCYRWFCCCCGSYTRFCCFLLVVVLLAIAATTAGVVLAQRAQSSSSSSSSEAAATGGTPAPSPAGPDPCPLELANMEMCFGDKEAENACESCVVQYWPTKVDNCEDIDDETCSAFRECPCAPCVDAVDSYVHCLSGCKVECADFAGGTLSPTVTPAPTPPLLCPDQYQEFDDCVDPDQGGSDCENCVVANWPPPPAKLSCQEIADNTCPVLAQEDNCGCNQCNVQLLNVLICLSNCTTLACGEGGNGTGTRSRYLGSARHVADSSFFRRSLAEYLLP